MTPTRNPFGPTILAIALVLCALPVFDRDAAADSWMAPRPRLDVSADGRWYVILEPTPTLSAARFRLVERKPGAPRRQPGKGEAFAPLPGDRVAATGECHLPVEVFCLDGGDGFVLFETYANLGRGTVAARHDGHGKRLWSLVLGDLFTREQIGGFRNSVSSTWWYESAALDRKADDLVVVYEQPRHVPADAPIHGPNLGKKRAPGVLRISIVDGAHHFGKPADLLKLVGQGTTERQIEVLDAISRTRPTGWKPSFQRLLADEKAALAVRVMAAVHLKAAGDARGLDLVRKAATKGSPDDARAAALEHLPAFLGVDAMPLLRAVLREKLPPAVGLAVWRAIRSLGAAALDPLIAMVGETDAPPAYRVTAIQLLGQLGAEAGSALPALHRAAQGKDADVADHAKETARVIRQALKQAPPK
jgi:hypothetical protein